MASKMIGFIGPDKYDILLYLAKVLSGLEQKVLLVDYAENRALTYCIPKPSIYEPKPTMQIENTVSKMEHIVFHDQTEKISYQGIDFLVEPVYRNLLLLQEQYDVILIDFGFQVYSKLISNCNQIFLCLDQQYHHIMPIKPFGRYDEKIKEKSFLLLREVYDCKISIGYIMEELGIYLPEERTFQYYQESIDMKYCIDSQYNYTFRFMKVSRGLKHCILFLLRMILPEINDHDMKYAYRCASTAKSLSKRGRIVEGL